MTRSFFFFKSITLRKAFIAWAFNVEKQIQTKELLQATLRKFMNHKTIMCMKKWHNYVLNRKYSREQVAFWIFFYFFCTLILFYLTLSSLLE